MFKLLAGNKKILFITLILIIFSAVNVYAVTGREVMERVDDKNTGQSRHSLMGMDLIEENGDRRQRVIEVWSKKQAENKDLDKTVMVFYEPASVKDTRFLQIENEDADDDSGFIFQI